MVQLLFFIGVVMVCYMVLAAFVDTTPTEIDEENSFNPRYDLFGDLKYTRNSPIWAGRINRTKKSNMSRVSKNTRLKHKKK